MSIEGLLKSALVYCESARRAKQLSLCKLQIKQCIQPLLEQALSEPAPAEPRDGDFGFNEQGGLIILSQSDFGKDAWDFVGDAQKYSAMVKTTLGNINDVARLLGAKKE